MAKTAFKGKPVDLPKRVFMINGFEIPEYDPVDRDWSTVVVWNWDKETVFPCKTHRGAVYALQHKISLRPDLMKRIEIRFGTMNRVVWESDWSEAKRLTAWHNERVAADYS